MTLRDGTFMLQNGTLAADAAAPEPPRTRDAARPAGARRPLVLHITGDYPDGVREGTTEAVKRLIDGAGDCDHVVFSLKRLADPRKGYLVERPAPPGQRLFAYGHFGLPLGVGLAAAFRRVAARIAAVLEREGLRPDIVHSHRLTFDGLAGHRLARRYGAAHFVSVRGEVESKVFRFKPTYRPLLARVVREAARVYYVSAWFAPHLERAAGPLNGKARALPNIIHNARADIAPVPPRPAFVAGAQLDVWRRKGLDRLIAAFARAGERLEGAGLDVYGSGAPASHAHLEALIRRHGLEGRVRLMGRVPNDEFTAALPGYLALALPARNETFGMVYTEALFAGVPILYARGTGIDGYLDGLEVGAGVDPDDVDAIAEALVTLRRGNAGYRARIAASAGELHRRFDPARALAGYARDIAACAPAVNRDGRNASAAG